jgi:hypothetical protein
MNLNPFAFLIETKTFPLARFQRSSLWNKIKDTFEVLAGNSLVVNSLLRDLFREDFFAYDIGAIDYLTLGIFLWVDLLGQLLLYAVRFLWSHETQNLMARLKQTLPNYVYNVVNFCLNSTGIALFVLFFVFLIINVLLLIPLNLTRLCASALLTLLSAPIVALAHVYFSLQGEGLQLRKDAFGQFDESSMTTDEGADICQQTDAFNRACRAIHLIQDESFYTSYYDERRHSHLLTFTSWNLEPEMFFNTIYTESAFADQNRGFDGRVKSQLSSDTQIVGALGRNSPITLCFKNSRIKEDKHLTGIEIRHGEQKKLMWLRAILALNIGGMARRLESEDGRLSFWTEKDIESSKEFPVNQRQPHQRISSVTYSSAELHLWLDLIDKMQTFECPIPSEIIPEDALAKHVFAFMP